MFGWNCHLASMLLRIMPTLASKQNEWATPLYLTGNSKRLLGIGDSVLKQPCEEPPRQYPRHPAAVMAGGEGGLHRHDLVAHQGVEALEHAVVEAAAGEIGRAGEQHRTRVGAGDCDAQVGERVAITDRKSTR